MNIGETLNLHITLIRTEHGYAAMCNGATGLNDQSPGTAVSAAVTALLRPPPRQPSRTRQMHRYQHAHTPAFYVHLSVAHFDVATRWASGQTLKAISADLGLGFEKVRALRGEAIYKTGHAWTMTNPVPRGMWENFDPEAKAFQSRAFWAQALAEFAPTIDTSKIKGE